jgi:hypothetical protein
VAEYAEALSMPHGRSKKPKNELQSISLKKSDNGGVVAEHRMTSFDGKEPIHAFGADEGQKLAAHIEQHMGIKMGAGQPEEEA